MAEIKAIETVYNGYRFRSRLEARWAVFFDYIGIAYEYEPEGFDLGDNLFYLPDFYLPETNAWVEIKGKQLTDTDREKIIRFCDAECDFANGGAKFRLLEGQIPMELISANGLIGIFCYNYVSPDEFQMFPYCNKGEKLKKGILFGACWTPKCSTEEMINGLIKARQARFEHGESGYRGR